MTDTNILNSISSAFENRTELYGLEFEDISKGDRIVRVIYVAHVTDRLFSILNQCISDYSDNNDIHVTLKEKSRNAITTGPEARLLLRVLSESQNINQHSFPSDFFERYTYSVAGSEDQIVSAANHIVTGRRGAGKSMLLLYAYKKRQANQQPNIWIDLQTYSGRDDERAVIDVVVEILYSFDFAEEVLSDALILRHKLESNVEKIEELRRSIPRLRRMLYATSKANDIFVFLDDLHVFDGKLQHLLLDVLYPMFRGNRIFLKASAIETLLIPYNSRTKMGIEVPQDAQRLGLDYNLTIPDKAAAHIESILDAHARYAALPSIRRLCASADVLPRLTWVSAGVPRDAINLFSQSLLKSNAGQKGRVTVSNVNMAASENLSIKLKDMQADATASADDLRDVLERIRSFCVTETKSNAFLVEITPSNETFSKVLQLVQLRLLHVISEGITPKEAGKKFMALMLDFGFYTGVRAAASVELFNKDTTSVTAKELRRLKIFKI